MSEDIGTMSDGYHTFNELYEHRHMLFISLMKCKPDKSWISKIHNDGTSFDESFIGGIDLPSGTITYHMPLQHWNLAKLTGAQILDKAPKWDGHTSDDVLKRLNKDIIGTSSFKKFVKDV